LFIGITNTPVKGIDKQLNALESIRSEHRREHILTKSQTRSLKLSVYPPNSGFVNALMRSLAERPLSQFFGQNLPVSFRPLFRRTARGYQPAASADVAFQRPPSLLADAPVRPRCQRTLIQSAWRAFNGNRKEDTIFKPEGHNSLSPYLIVDDAQATLDFIKAVFNAEPELIHRAEDNAIAHAEVRIDDTILMVGKWKGSGSVAHVHVYVPNVRNSFELARKAGGGRSRSRSEKMIPICAAES
jgi:PhnB protein